MRWKNDRRKKSGGYWICREKDRERCRRYRDSPEGQLNEMLRGMTRVRTRY